MSQKLVSQIYNKRGYRLLSKLKRLLPFKHSSMSILRKQAPTATLGRPKPGPRTAHQRMWAAAG